MVERKKRPSFENEVRKIVDDFKKGKIHLRDAITMFPKPDKCPLKEKEV